MTGRFLVFIFAFVAVLCVVLAVWIIVMNTFGAMSLYGEKLIANFKDHKQGREIFVYHLSEIPNGFISTRIAIRKGCLPFESTQLTVYAPFQEFRREKDDLLLLFTWGPMAHYYHTNGKVELVEP